LPAKGKLASSFIHAGTVPSGTKSPRTSRVFCGASRGKVWGPYSAGCQRWADGTGSLLCRRAIHGALTRMPLSC
jgi:hypothetical protein